MDKIDPTQENGQGGDIGTQVWPSDVMMISKWLLLRRQRGGHGDRRLSGGVVTITYILLFPGRLYSGGEGDLRTHRGGSVGVTDIVDDTGVLAYRL